MVNFQNVIFHLKYKYTPTEKCSNCVFTETSKNTVFLHAQRLAKTTEQNHLNRFVNHSNIIIHFLLFLFIPLNFHTHRTTFWVFFSGSNNNSKPRPRTTIGTSKIQNLFQNMEKLKKLKTPKRLQKLTFCLCSDWLKTWIINFSVFKIFARGNILGCANWKIIFPASENISAVSLQLQGTLSPTTGCRTPVITANLKKCIMPSIFPSKSWFRTSLSTMYVAKIYFTALRISISPFLKGKMSITEPRLQKIYLLLWGQHFITIICYRKILNKVNMLQERIF